MPPDEPCLQPVVPPSAFESFRVEVTKDFCGFDVFDENFKAVGDLLTAAGVVSGMLAERQVRQRLAYDEAFWVANLRLHDTQVDTTIPCFLQMDVIVEDITILTSYNYSTKLP